MVSLSIAREAKLNTVVSRFGEGGLEAVKGLGWRGVHAVEHGQVDAHQVAQQYQRQHSLESAVAAGLDPDDRRAGGLYLRGRELDAPVDARVLVGVLEEDGREGGEGAAAGPAADLVVVGLGQLAPEGRRGGVLVQLRLPAPGRG